MKYNKILSAFAAFLLMGAASCTDEWNEHYAVKQHALGEGTLWEAMSKDPQVSNFMQVLQATGYDKLLNSSQVFTVFAPANGDITAEQRDKLIAQYQAEKAAGVKDEKNTVIKEFVKNHIALYNYNTTDGMETKAISMLNGKNIQLTTSTFGDKAFTSSNINTGNGVLYTIGKHVEYKPNVYEFLGKYKGSSSRISAPVDEGLDSLYKFLSADVREEFLPNKSVPGEIVDGQTVYLDSVTETRSDFFEHQLRALINREDSNYWMVAPTNEQWREHMAKAEKYYNYDQMLQSKQKKLVDSLRYHMPRRALLQGTVFSKCWNKNIFETKTSTASDSLLSTNAIGYKNRKSQFGSYKGYYQYTDPFGANGILSDCAVTEVSNGKVYVPREWKIKPKDTFLKQIVAEGENPSTIDSLNTYPKSGTTNPAKYVSVAQDNPFYHQVSGHSYVEITSKGLNNFEDACFQVKNVLSNMPYKIIVVTVPAEAGDTAATAEQRKPTKIQLSVQCNNEKGAPYYMTVGTNKLEKQVYKNDIIDQKNIVTRNKYLSTVRYEFTTEAGKVTRHEIGDSGHYFIFPTSSYGLDEAQVRLLMKCNIPNRTDYNSTLRIDAIIFEPHPELLDNAN